MNSREQYTGFPQEGWFRALHRVAVSGSGAESG